MLKYLRPLIYPFILLILFLMPQTYASLSSSTFTSAEHLIMGNEVTIHPNLNDPPVPAYKFHLPSGLDATYGDIISIADLYGEPGKPISQGAGEYARKARFIAAFKLFAVDTTHLKEATKIVASIHEEQRLVSAGMEKGQRPEDIYKKISDDFDRRLNCITGGGCANSSWWLNPGRYLKLAYNNYDHFGNNAWRTYQVGHAIALEKAISAHANQDTQKLQVAYAINAFASHFLADRFSSGHIRTPRMWIPIGVNPSIVGNILTNYMHNEENKYGLHVYNKLGRHWIAYGDQSFLNPNCSEHRHILQEVLQESANQIFEAFKTGVVPEDHILDLVPYAEEANDQSNHDISPMFFYDDQTKILYRRSDLSNPYDRHWTTSWWGWSTLYELRDRNGMKASDQAILALSNYSHEALHKGLITDKEMLAYLYHSVS